MKNVITRAKNVLSGEQGGPSIEQLGGIVVAIVLIGALILLGNTVKGKIDGAKTTINAIDTTDSLPTADFS